MKKNPSNFSKYEIDNPFIEIRQSKENEVRTNSERLC